MSHRVVAVLWPHLGAFKVKQLKFQDVIVATPVSGPQRYLDNALALLATYGWSLCMDDKLQVYAMKLFLWGP